MFKQLRSKRKVFIRVVVPYVAAACSDSLLIEEQMHRNLEGRNLLDRSWPADNCCRIYEHDRFTGEDRNGEDFCTDERSGQKKIFDFEQ